LVREAIPDVAEEVAAFGIGLKELFVLISREGEVAIDFAAVKVESWCSRGRPRGRERSRSSSESPGSLSGRISIMRTMSRQLRVFLLRSDIDAVFGELLRHMAVRILREESPTAEPVELICPVQDDSVASGDTKVRTSVRCFLAPDEAADLDIQAVPRFGKWVIDTRSEAIEFSGCGFDGATLLDGRFYYQKDVLIDGALVLKRATFTKWANGVFRVVKKCLRWDAELYAYVGKDASDFRSRGGRFAAHIGPKGQPIYV
jgi:hypothetical protein